MHKLCSVLLAETKEDFFKVQVAQHVHYVFWTIKFCKRQTKLLGMHIEYYHHSIADLSPSRCGEVILSLGMTSAGFIHFFFLSVELQFDVQLSSNLWRTSVQIGP